LLADVGLAAGAKREALQKEVEDGVEAIMGLMCVQPPAKMMTSEQRKQLLREAAQGKLPSWIQAQCDAVGGVDKCLDALVEAMERGLESQVLYCS
jgi:hypothetical protein